MDLKIRGKVALITASGRGLGRSSAQCLAREGVSIIASSRTERDLQELMTLLPHPPHTFFVADLATEEGPRSLLNFLERERLQPDIVVHNLGGNLDVTNPFCSLAEWRSVFRINLDVPVELNRALIPKMQERGWGRVCHVSSIAALENQGPPSYCAAKAALLAYTRSLGRYVAKEGVVMTSILPGAVYTEGGYWAVASKTRLEHVERYLKERMAIQRFGTPEEIGEIVAFLCSDLSSFCVGSAFLADGGQGRVFFNQVNSE